MENTLYVGLSRQVVLRNNMNIIANNIANANTPGYRSQNIMFKEYVSNPRGTDAPLSFVNDIGQYHTTEQGAMKLTENPLNIALSGAGYMGVIGPDGKVAYTRAGDLEISTDGTLVTPAGHAISSAGGGSISIPEDSTELKIDNKGVISNQQGQIGQLMIVEFKNIQSLKPQGNNLYRTDEPGLPAEKTSVKQGYLEASNVQAVVEMTRMIDTLRTFQSVNQLMQNENERLRTAVQTLSRPT